MTLETILNLLPCELDGYALHITHFYLDDEEAYLWQIAYIDGKDKCIYYTSRVSLENAAMQVIRDLLKRNKHNNIIGTPEHIKTALDVMDKKGGEQ